MVSDWDLTSPSHPNIVRLDSLLASEVWKWWSCEVHELEEALKDAATAVCFCFEWPWYGSRLQQKPAQPHKRERDKTGA